MRDQVGTEMRILSAWWGGPTCLAIIIMTNDVKVSVIMSIQTLIYLFTYLFIYLFIYPRRKDYVATYTVINMMKR